MHHRLKFKVRLCITGRFFHAPPDKIIKISKSSVAPILVDDTSEALLAFYVVTFPGLSLQPFHPRYSIPWACFQGPKSGGSLLHIDSVVVYHQDSKSCQGSFHNGLVGCGRCLSATDHERQGPQLCLLGFAHSPGTKSQQWLLTTMMS